MTFATKLYRTVPRLVLAFSVMVAGMIPMVPMQAQAQSVLERLFGAPTAAHRRKIGQAAPKRTIGRQVIRKRTVKRSVKRQRQSASRSSRSSARSRSASATSSRGSSYTYRTLCVRKADGYFFPVSFSTTEDYFDRDMEACEARCPGTEVDLYFHRVLREEAENMVSHSTGKNYTDLATAFAYKTKGIDATAAKACEIEPEPAFKIEVADDLGELPFQSAIPLPIRRPEPQAILVSDLRGGSKDVAEVSNRQKVIRRVGPRFFPDQ
ncbi:DUF2865 domain-containing protein [Fulvimarina sp. MAC3]|uniref:DUF2865 domain-containing protein n=1 Tax=Fulvimarina sp. MAC3 TaxID=3148887 RepID=UPI0031FC2A63